MLEQLDSKGKKNTNELKRQKERLAKETGREAKQREITVQE